MKIVAMVIIISLSILMVFHIPTINADFTLTLEHKEHFQIRWNTLESLVGLVGSEVGYNLIAGETLFVSWKITEQPLILPPRVWLLTKEQSYHFSHIIGGPVPFYNYILRTITWEGNFTYTVPQNGTYCVVLDNPAWGALDLTGPILDVQVYEADLTVPTQEEAPISSVGGTWTPISDSRFLSSWISLFSLLTAFTLLLTRYRKLNQNEP